MNPVATRSTDAVALSVFRWLRLAAACCLVAASDARAADAVAPGDPPATARRGNVLALRKLPAPRPDHAPAIEAFVRTAAARDLDAMFALFDAVPVRANGEAAIRHFIATDVVSFFVDAIGLDRSMRVTSASFEDGSEGLMAYAYVLTAGGEAKPFVIAWRPGTEATALRVMDVQLGRCVPARHPVAPGHCERRPD